MAIGLRAMPGRTERRDRTTALCTIYRVRIDPSGVRGRLFDVTCDDLLAEQVRYYRARALEYDYAYAHVGQYDRGRDANDAWRAELARLVALFDGAELGNEVLEVAAGTGFWTARLLERGAAVTAVDAAPEALDVNRQRLGEESASVDYIVADLFHWRPARLWDSCVGFFWLCKIPDDRLQSFLQTVATAVHPGGTVFFGDKTSTAGGTPGSELETRALEDGRTFTVVDRPRSSNEFRQAFAGVGIDVDVVILGHGFAAVTGIR
ncbi:MAG: class I SAM-dependent methyltransferase [Actinomycetota bacterium]